jgi:hypothetical protein
MMNLVQTGKEITLHEAVFNPDNKLIEVLSKLEDGRRLIKINFGKAKDKYYMERKRHKKFKKHIIFKELAEEKQD